MSNRRERYNRDWILSKYAEDPCQTIKIYGYLSLNPNSKWVTFTQIENENGLRISGHLNFPKHKVYALIKDVERYNHKPFSIKGHPSFYLWKGTKRGSIKILDLQPKTN